jgi:hypothetical protein
VQASARLAAVAAAAASAGPPLAGAPASGAAPNASQPGGGGDTAPAKKARWTKALSLALAALLAEDEAALRTRPATAEQAGHRVAALLATDTGRATSLSVAANRVKEAANEHALKKGWRTGRKRKTAELDGPGRGRRRRGWRRNSRDAAAAVGERLQEGGGGGAARG